MDVIGLRTQILSEQRGGEGRKGILSGKKQSREIQVSRSLFAPIIQSEEEFVFWKLSPRSVYLHFPWGGGNRRLVVVSEALEVQLNGTLGRRKGAGFQVRQCCYWR